jgi:hypothetical protein
MRLNRAEWAALNAAVAVAEDTVKDFQSPEGIALRGRVIAARAMLTDAVPDEDRPKHNYLPSRHPARNN